MAATLPPPSALSRVLKNLQQKPQLKLSNVKSLKLTLAAKNDHFGARHFLTDELPRIRYANPDIEIQVQKAVKTKADVWRPELKVEYVTGKTDTLNLNGKWSTTIVRLLMDRTGHKDWKRWVSDAQSQGTPTLPGEEVEARYLKTNLANGVSAVTLGVDPVAAWETPGPEQPPPLENAIKAPNAEVKTRGKPRKMGQTEAQRVDAQAQRLKQKRGDQAALDRVVSDQAAKQAEVDRVLKEMAHTAKKGAAMALP